MADYQQQQQQQQGQQRRSDQRSPPQNYGHSSDFQRETAFNNIFGAAPGPGRSHTMTSSSMPPPELMMQHQQQQQQGRTHTMGGSMQRPPPSRHPQGAGPYGEPPYPPRNRPIDDRGMQGGYYPGPQQRPPSSGHQVPSPQAQYLQQQQQARRYPGQPGQPGQPPRFDSRPPPPRDGYGNMRPPAPRGYYPGGGQPGPAMNSDPYRTQSLASAPRQPVYHPPPSAYQQGLHNNFRQSPPGQPPNNGPSARTTAQGRVVPDRHDDRSMSMTGGYPSHERDAHQTMSGRVIPNRRVPGTAPQLPELPISNGFSNGYSAAPGSQTRTTSMVSSTSTNDSQQRTMSMASTAAPSIAPSELSESNTLVNRSSMARSTDGERPSTARVRPPLVYPALLSRVAECFRQKIIVGDKTKNGLTYKNAFTGADAVDVLSYIIRTTDRNLALLLGRALDAQKFFHDVTYEHRLRDSNTEMYQFKETMTEEEEEKPGVDGVFVLLSECYSPTCTRDQLCYSIACPRRLEQVSRLNLRLGPGLRDEGAAVHEDDVEQTDEQKLWINTVPKEIADSVGDREKKRQEVISEICYTERDFVKDLEYLRDFWINPLRSRNSPIPQNRKDRVVRNIFSNIIDHPSIHSVSSRFAKSLTDRQQKNPVVHNVGDIFREFVPQFEPFILYGAKQLEAKFEFENERSTNQQFSRFVDEIERRKESRKLELNGYLTKPTTRLARYPLLLENVLKYTEADNPDKEDIPKVLTLIRALLTRVNAESGKAENRFNLRRLSENLKFRPNERVDLRLTEEGRELVFKTQLKKTLTENADMTAFLFDHAVLIARTKQVGRTEETKAYRRPIPLELLSIKEMEEVIPHGTQVRRTSSSLLPLRAAASDTKKGDGWPITFRHLGKAGYELTLYAQNQVARQKWLEFIDAAQQRLRGRADFLNMTTISAGFFGPSNKVNCVVPFDGGRKLVYGTDTGIYISDRKSKESNPKQVINTTNVTQLDVLEEYQLLLVLTSKTLYSFPLSALDPLEPPSSKKGKKIQSSCHFFRVGICLGRHLVCCVKPTALSTTIKVYEPNDAISATRRQRGLGRMFNAGQDELKPFKEFYIPTESYSVHFLRSKLCVACSRGFEVVALETLETQSLLDQADTSLDFVARKEGVVRPIHIERLNGEFLLNYSEFSFFVNRNGWRARPEWRIDWEGTPQSFALSYPWILAFEPNFIELRHIDSGAVHIVPHKNIRMLHSSTHEIIFAYEDEKGEDIVEAMDFWKSQRRSEIPDATEERPPTASSTSGTIPGYHPRMST
ncbi:Rho1 guanine nucleotide exchange factor 1 [Gaeumannomyces tritici R3-111a-1]|uniref:Rho1 guanine nucleotide exchange factor 1 n=1 Tax=Gaeumannomyces tritici (strain R3-111a-1) TaxID=644352 RepID=J3PD08_GAET3|nr:Rho1 guanine nucleotide exchange factor 1 [Gaeumannomyces tritici R3-111a-1]EJT70353.1 Rho1 guanine nucleotide exchange factor 1 [Gaeumannomyces tritici R3-111a-1]